MIPNGAIRIQEKIMPSPSKTDGTNPAKLRWSEQEIAP